MRKQHTILILISSAYLFFVYYVYENVALYNVLKYSILPVIIVQSCLVFKDIKKIEHKFGMFFIAHLVFVLYVFVVNSFHLNADPNSFIPLLSAVVTSFVLAIIIDTKKDFLLFVSAMYMGSFCVAISYFIVGKDFINESVQFVLDENTNANGIAHMFSLGFICNAILLFCIDNKILKFLFSITLLIFIFIFLLVGSRQAFVLTFAFVLVYYCLFFKISYKKHCQGFLYIILTIIVAFFFVYITYLAFPQNPLFTKFVESEDNSRLELVKYAMELFDQRPLLGYGFGSFRNYSYFVYTHNMYTEILFSGGIIGTAIFFFPMLIYMYDLYRQLNVETISYRRRVLSFTLAFMISYCVGGAFFIMYNSAIAYMLLFILMRYVQIADK